MKRAEKRKKRNMEERVDRLDWWIFIGDLLLFIPRVFIRLFRWITDMF
ncbi:hypothetical protein [Oceanobacillus sp. FSL H7-0719]